MKTILLLCLALLPLQSGEPLCDDWWDQPDPWWVLSYVHLEAVECEAPLLAHNTYSVSHDGVTVTFTASDEYLSLDWLDGDLQDEETFGRVAIRDVAGESIRIDWSYPIEDVVIYIGAHDCSEAIPGWYCYDEDDNFISGDCVAPGVGCSTFGPSDCDPALDGNYQWYFANAPCNPITHVCTAIEWCELVSEGREVFIGSLGFDVCHPPPGPPGPQ